MIKLKRFDFFLMPGRRSAFMLFLLSVLYLGSNAQVTITIPVNNDNDEEQNNPYGAPSAYHRTQTLYRANEIGISGNITTISFFVNDLDNPAASTPVVVKLKNTHNTNVTPMSYDDASADAITVYTGNILNTQLAVNSWITIALPVPFTYAGYNLELFVETNAGTPNSEPWEGKMFRWSEAGFNASQTWSGWNTPPGPDDYGYVMNTHPNTRFTITPAPLMSYATSRVSQVAGNAHASTNGRAIIGIQVEMDGLTSPLSATAFALNTAGSATTPGLLQNAKLYYTGIDPSFNTQTPFGSAVSSPSGTFNITGNQVLDVGINYFWLTYDIGAGALIGDSLDASCTQVTIGGVTHVPTITAPAGNMLIGRLHDFEGPSNQSFSSLSFSNNPPDWQRGVPVAGPPAAYSGTTCWGTMNGIVRNTESVLETPSYIASSDNVGVNYKQWYDFDYQYNDVEATFEYEINGNGSWSQLKRVNLNPLYTTGTDWVDVFAQVPAVTGDTVRFRWHMFAGNYADPGPGWYIDNFVVSGAGTYNQTYTMSSTVQVSTLATKGDKKQGVVAVVIETKGTESPLSATSLNFTTGAGSTGIIESAKVFYTGTSKYFDSTTQYGAAFTAPSGAFAITGTQPLLHGPNYFWLTYDIAPTAVSGDSVDATCTQITVSTTNYIPDETDPQGVLPIGSLYDFDAAGLENFSAASLNSRPNEWQKGSPSYGPSSAFSGTDCWGTNLFGDYARSADYVMMSPSYIAQSDVFGASFMQWFDLAYTGSGANALFEYQVNNSGSWSPIYFVDNSLYANSNNKWENVFSQGYANPGDTVQFRWHFSTNMWASQAPGWYIDNFAIAGLKTYSQSFISSTSKGITAAAAAGSENQPVAVVVVDMSGTDNALPLTELKFNTNGTGTVANIKNARVFYTGNTNAFDASTQFGSDVASPSGTFTITGSQDLMAGTNFFWLAYDVDSSAAINDSLDAEITQLTIDATNHVPDITAAEGVLSIGNMFDFDTTGKQDFHSHSLNQNPDQWEKGTPSYGPSGAFSGTDCWATNLSGDFNNSSDYELQTPPFIVTSATVNTGFRQWFDFMYTGSSIIADFQYDVNNTGWNYAYAIDNNAVANSNDKWEHIQSTLSGMNPGDTIRFRWHFSSDRWSSPGAGWYLDNFIVSGVEKFNQSFVQSSVRQVAEATLPGTRNQAIINIAVEVSGTENPLTVTDFNLGTAGSVSAIIEDAKLFYTGLSTTFDNTTQFGSTVTTPGTTYSISGNQPLSSGINNFWLTYTVDANALVGDSLDAACSQITISAVTHAPTGASPSGNVPVARLYDFDTIGQQDFSAASLNSKINEWQKGVPNYGPASAFSGSECWGTDLDGDYTNDANYILTTPPYVSQSDVSYISYKQWFDFAYSGNNIDATFEYNINNNGWFTAAFIDNTMRDNSNYDWEHVGTQISSTPGDTVQFRWHFGSRNYSSTAPGWYIDNFTVSGMKLFDQYCKESYAEQVFGVTSSGASNQPILRVVVDAAGSENPVDATGFNFGTSGSVSGIVKSAKLFYTGASNKFDTTTQYGATVATPTSLFSIGGMQKLLPGLNYFWLAYDIETSAVDGDSLDAEFIQMTTGVSSTHTPTTGNPAGVMPVGHLYAFDAAGKEDFSTVTLNLKPSEWEYGVPVPGSGPDAAYSGTSCWGTNLSGNFALKSDYALLSPPFVARGTEMNLSHKHWYDFIYNSWNKQAQFQYQINNSGSWNTISFIDLQNVSSSDNKWLSEENQLTVTPGDTVQFRWRLYTGTYDPAPGWYIDDFLISGADALDALPPSISYTPLMHIGNNTNRTLTNFASISDLTGVNVTSGTNPRIYYKKKSEANAFVGNSSVNNGWKYSEASNSASPFSFVIDYSLLTSAVVLNDTIEYFVTAQDISSPAHVGASPSEGFDATTVNAIVSAPTVPAYYIITASPMAGNYNVGSGQVYTTLSAAVTDVNLRGVSGAVTLSLTNSNYSLLTGETFPITFYPVAGSSATNTITVKPAAATSVSFTSNNAIFKIQGADYITINGSNNGTTSRDLTLVSTGNTGMVWICANTGTDGAEHNTIKNMIMRGDQTTKFGVYAGGKDYTSATTGPLAPSSYNTIENNLITKTVYGICMVGVSKTKRDVDNVITNNQVGDATNWISLMGIYTLHHQGDKVMNNSIQNLNFNYTNYYNPSGGIYLEDCKQGLVSGNKVSNWGSTLGDTRMTGIYVDGGEDGWDHLPLPTNNVIANNFVGGGYSNSTNVWSINGLAILNGNGDKVYFNTVSFSGTVLVTDGEVIAFRSGYERMQNLEVKNNIFQINGTSSVSTRFYAYNSYIDPGHGTVSDYNVISSVATGSAEAFIGQYQNNQANTLSDWQAITAADANSKSGLVTFVSANDLHLAGASIGDTANLLGVTIAGFGTDIDGDARRVNAPYIGADENLATPLPVKLLEFNGVAQRFDVLLNWSTASEINNKGFAVERSVNNKSFEEIGFVYGKGNSTSVSGYAYTDKEAFTHADVLYYRLKQLDKDGRYTYSKAIRVSRNDAAGASAPAVVYPNPFNKDVFVQLETADAATVNLVLMDLAGRVILNNNVEVLKGMNTINVLSNDQLEAGVYFLTIEANGKKQVQKLIKQ